MCDYSIVLAKSRPASVGDKLTTHKFGGGTIGFCSPSEPDVAVCVLPGTELAFDEPVKVLAHHGIYSQEANGWINATEARTIETKTARFRQIDKDNPFTHHDACEFGDGDFVLLTRLAECQSATVLQLPAAPKNEQEAKEQERIPVAA